MRKIMILLALASSAAMAAPGYLQSCSYGTGPGGGMALIGVYTVGGMGTPVVMYFSPDIGTCPVEIDVP